MKFLKKSVSICLVLILLSSIFSGAVIDAKALSDEIKYYESIPEKVYAIVGDPFEMYYSNIISRPEMTIVFSSSEYVKIDYYNKKAEFTAQIPGDFDIVWRIYDENYVFVGSGVMTLVARTENLKNMTVLVIGDSTVKPGTMTQEMQRLFKNGGSKLTLLGSLGTGENLHEGRSGWRSYDYCESQARGEITNPFYNKGFDFAYYMNSQGYKKVDAVVIQLGINDIKKFTRKNYSNKKTFEAFDSFVSSIKSYNEGISIVISLTIPPNENKEVFEGTNKCAPPEEYRPNIIRFVAEMIERYKNTENVYFSATNCSIDTATEIKDIVHPTDVGYRQMAKNHVDALNFIMNKVVLPEPTKIISASYKGDGIEIKWEPKADVDFYEVIRKDKGVLAKIKDASFKDNTVVLSENYQYIVRTHFKNGKVFDSQSRSINIPKAPELIAATNHTKGVKITWNEVHGASAYVVYRKNSNSKWVNLGTVKTRYFVDSDVSSGKTYTYTVKAKSNTCAGDFDKVGVSCQYIATPKLSSATNKNNYVQVNWQAVKGAKGYFVYRKTSKNGKWKKIAQTNNTVYKDKNIKSNSDCFYTVRAYNGSILSSYISSGVATKYLSVPKLTKISTGKTGVVINFSAVKGSKNYYIYRKTAGASWKKIATVSGGKTYYLDKGAVKGTKYAYTVRAVNGKHLSYYDTKGLVITDKY